MAAPTNITVEEFQETTDFTFNPLSTPLPHSMPPPPPLSDLAPNQQLADHVDEFSLFADMVDEFNLDEFPWLADNVGEFSLAASQRLTDNVDVPFGFSTRESMILPQQQQELLGYSSDASDFSADIDLSGATDMSVATDLGGATEDDEVGEMEKGAMTLLDLWRCVEKGKMKEKTPSSKIKFKEFSLNHYLAANQQLANNVGEYHPTANQQLADNVGVFSLAANQQLADNVGEFSLVANQQLADNVDLPFRESMILPQQQQEPLGYLSDASDFSAATDLSGATDMSVATDLDGATGDDEVGIRVEGTGVLGEMEDGQLNSRCLEKGKMKEKTSRGEGNKKTTGVRIAIPLENILLTKEMTIKDAAKHLKVGRSTLKRACREYGIHRWPPRMGKNLNGSLSVVDQEGISQLESHKLTPSNQVSATVDDTNSVMVKARYRQNSWFADNDVGGFSLSYLAANQQLADNVDALCYTRESMILPQQRQELLGYSSDASDFSAATDMSVGTDLGGATEDDEVGMVRVISLAHFADQQLADNLDLPFSFSTRESMILPQQDQEPLGYLSDASDFSAATDLSGATDMSVATNLGGATGDDEVGIRVEGAWELGEMEEGQLNSRCLEKGKMKEKTSRGEGNKKTAGVRIAIPLENILLTKEMTIKDAAKHLKVSKSTLKRACREYGIDRWPPRMEKNLNGSLSVVDQEGISQLESHKLTPSNQVSATVDDTNSVMVKARYGYLTILFKLSRPWLLVELEQEVEKRLKLEAGTYYIKYKDAYNDLILIACDEDLQHYICGSIVQGTTSIEMHLYSKVIKTETFQEPFFTGKQLKDETLKLIVFIPSNERTLELQAKNHEIVKNIKLLIQLKKGILPEQYSLFYRGKLLEDNKTLASLNIQSESVLFLVFNPRDVMSVSVKMPSGEILKLEVKALHTIRDVKAIIQSMVGVKASNQNLTYEGSQVEDSKTLACYNIMENSILEMLPLPFQIFVKDLAGDITVLNVLKEDRVRDVKKKILDKRCLPVGVNNFYLWFARVRLEDDRDLASYNVEEDATLLVVYLAGASSEDHIQP